MRLLVLSTSTNNTNTFLGSLESLGEHEIHVMRYDGKWHQIASEAIQRDRNNLDLIQSGRMLIPRDKCAMDDDILLDAKINKYDTAIYISAWQGAFVPLNETLGELNQIVPTVHFLCDGADEPWWPQLREFERRGTFSLTVNIDGSHYWPGGGAWGQQDGAISKSLTLLTPVDVRHFAEPTFAFEERPYAIGYAGNASGPFRSEVVRRLSAVRGFAHKDRDAHPHSYPQFAEFLKHTRISVSVPFTGSGRARHVKGRILESGFAGACLLEWRNEATRSWFQSRAEYFEYESVEECAELAEWLAAHPKISRETARALTERVWKEHSPKAFWDTVLGALPT